ncbi:hypothetical protein TcasGA2_TC001488 [Tribolium castaneum]|uniref:Uncharacterized protein n=1 Tax=Tribolium castaneum TaxID=7070 RepID=D7ELM8_TRICA|nr:hypothetical protein TcasGA2_TC001488 [Tribolium castaneum]
MYSVEIELTYPETNETYTLYLAPEDAKRTEADVIFAQSLLFHAKCNKTKNPTLLTEPKFRIEAEVAEKQGWT